MRGQRGEDPNEPPSTDPYPYPPVAHESHIQALNDSLQRDGLHPLRLSLGILLDEKAGKTTPAKQCIRTPCFDGCPSPINDKADAQVMGVDPALQSRPNLTLLTGA